MSDFNKENIHDGSDARETPDLTGIPVPNFAITRGFFSDAPGTFTENATWVSKTLREIIALLCVTLPLGL